MSWYQQWFSWYRQQPFYYQVFLLVAVISLTIISVAAALKKGPGGDFHVFWEAGKRFWSGDPLYQQSKGRSFLYPPFSAFLFGLLGALPFTVAATLHALVNAAFVVVMVVLTAGIAQQTQGNYERGWLITAAVLTLPYFLGNLQLLQMNLVLGLFLLGGFYYYAKEQDLASGALLAAAVAFKVTPVIAYGWLLVRGRWRVLVWSMGFLLLFILGPWLIRGPSSGFQDILGFFQTLQAKLPDVSHVEEFKGNKSLTGLLLNWQYLTGNALPAWLIRLLPVSIGLAYMGWLVSLYRGSRPFHVKEWAITLLVMFLVSSVTRTAHLVPLVMVFYLLMAEPVLAKGHWQRSAVIATGFILLLTGRDVIGDQAFEWLVHVVNIKTLGLLALLGIAWLPDLKRLTQSLFQRQEANEH